MAIGFLSNLRFSPRSFLDHVACERVKRRRTTSRIYADEILTSDTLLSFLLPFSCVCLCDLVFCLTSTEKRATSFSQQRKTFREAAHSSGANVYLFDFWQQEHVVCWRHEGFSISTRSRLRCRRRFCQGEGGRWIEPGKIMNNWTLNVASNHLRLVWIHGWNGQHV